MKTDNYAKAFLASIRDEEFAVVFRRLKELLRRKHEEYLLPGIMRKAIRALERETGTQVISRYPLDEASQKQVLELLKKTFSDIGPDSVTFQTNSKLLGGVSIFHKDFLFDGTINASLEKHKHIHV